MSWFNFFTTKDTQKIQSFGRGINADLCKDEEELFNKSYEAFEKKDILDGYEYFFKSLENFSNGISNENIILKREDSKLYFELYQGTAKITGYTTQEHLYAESTLCQKKSANIALKRYILERNYQLTYVYYFIDDDAFIKLKLTLDNMTMSPHKIFYPLRELALNADFDKEYTRNEFIGIKLEDVSHLKESSQNELKIKYDFLHKWLHELRHKISTLPSNDKAGMEAFAYLCLLFKIDYLLVPKYEIYQKMSKKIAEYFGDENNTTEAKNDELKTYMDSLENMTFKEFCTNFYEAKYTFNPTERTSYEEINTFITDAMAKIRWYKNSRYVQIIPTIYEYISFNILYNFGIHQVLKELLQIAIEVQNPDFFEAYGYPVLYNKAENTFSKKLIISQIQEIIAPHKEHFKSLEPFGENLNFSSLNEFSNSFYLQIIELDFEDIQS